MILCSISNGSRDNSSTRFQRVSITRQKFVTSPTITWDPGDLQWNTLLIDCSSHRGAHFSHWHICSISNGSRDNSSTRFRRVSITRQKFVTSPTITWDPGVLQWNTLLIDCSSHRGAHFSLIDLCVLSQMVLEIIQVQGSAGFHYTPKICYITHYNLRSRRFKVKHTINRLFFSSRRTFFHWLICSISNGSRDNSSTRFQRVSITRQPFVTSPTITWDPGHLLCNTLLIDCSSHRGAHFCHWLMCSISNGSRYNSSTRFQRVSITRQKFVTSPTITWDPGVLKWNTLCSR